MFVRQHRGSTHEHGFLWLQGAPNVDEISVDDIDAVRSAIEYFGGLVSAIHPNVNYPSTDVNPCQVKYSDVTGPLVTLHRFLIVCNGTLNVSVIV
jgi:hypothetical protein